MENLLHDACTADWLYIKSLPSFQFQGLQKDDLVNLLCVLEAEVQARDVIISSILVSYIFSAVSAATLQYKETFTPYKESFEC